MMKEFEMTDIGKMSYYLAIEVKQKEDEIFISLQSYAKKMLNKFKMDRCKPIGTLMECKMKLSKFDEARKLDAIDFKSLVGSLWYLTHKTKHYICYWSTHQPIHRDSNHYSFQGCKTNSSLYQRNNRLWLMVLNK